MKPSSIGKPISYCVGYNSFHRYLPGLSAVTLVLGLAAPAMADTPVNTSAPVAATATSTDTSTTSWWQRAQGNMAATWQSNQYQLYLPLHTWHNRADYTSEKISGYNETPWGLGAGTYFYDSDGDWHSWYAMAFLDSHDRAEPIAGYGYQKIWRPVGDWRLGAGFTMGFTSRSDYHYYPIPLVLPLLSISYDRVSLQTTYVPGGKGYGNILFTWLTWSF